MSKVKSEQLDMSFGKANAILRKMILFHLIKESNKDICFRCNKKIKNIDELSIEHKVPWLYSDEPKELFFDLNNIAFSHLRCNSSYKNFRMSEEMKKCLSLKMSNEKYCKLSDKEIIEIREKLKNNPNYNLRKLGKEYNISHVQIIRIRDYKQRKYL
jgi:hypothetical protein